MICDSHSGHDVRSWQLAVDPTTAISVVKRGSDRGSVVAGRSEPLWLVTTGIATCLDLDLFDMTKAHPLTQDDS